jgi:hypothetical protein
VPTTVHTVRLILEQPGSIIPAFLLTVPSIVPATVGIIERSTSSSLYQLGPSLACQLLAFNLVTPLSSWINIFFSNMWKCLTVREFVLWANSQLFVEQNVVLVLIIVSFVFPQVLHLSVYNYAVCQSNLKCYWQLFLQTAVVDSVACSTISYSWRCIREVRSCRPLYSCCWCAWYYYHVFHMTFAV